MYWTAGPALGISLVLFLILGFTADPSGATSTEAAQGALEDAFNISFLNLLPLLLLVVFSIRTVPAVPVDPGVRAVRGHPGVLHAVGGRPGVRR